MLSELLPQHTHTQRQDDLKKVEYYAEFCICVASYCDYQEPKASSRNTS